MIKYDFRTYVQGTNENYDNKIKEIQEKIINNPMNGWYYLDNCISKDELQKVINLSNHIRDNYDTMIVIGIGGSYLGSQAIIDMFRSYFNKSQPEIIFAGTSLSAAYLKELTSYIEDKNIIINVVSKSGNTLETNIVFEYFEKYLNNKYSPEEVIKRIIITTDPKNGHFREIVNKKKYQSLTISSNIGGRFSVLTAAGLLPIAVSGINVNELLEGAKRCNHQDAIEYAITRDKLYNSGKIIESFTIYEPKLQHFTEWLKQLFAESQGKDNKGILPISAINTRDLHSLGQYYQEGSRVLFETVIGIRKTTSQWIDKYQKELDEINLIALNSVVKAHNENKTNSNIILLDELTVINVGELIFFFELAATYGAYLLNLNPFDQPGVEKYKEKIKDALGE